MDSPRRKLRSFAAIAAAAALCCVGLTLRTASGAQNEKPAPAAQPETSETNRIPAYHHHPPKGPLPKTLSPDLFPPGSMQRKAYAMAAKIKAVLYQQPCYCYCDRDDHHHCLLDCYRTRHASGCGICMGEAIFAYEETQKGRTPAQIRKEIIAGKWREALAGK